jgi:hypothetical protein
MLTTRSIPYTFDGSIELLDGQMIETKVIGIDTLTTKEAFALQVRLDDLTQSVKITKFVGIENIIDEDNLLSKRDGNVHSHRYAGHDELAMLHQCDKLLEMEIAEILSAPVRPKLDLAVALIFVGSTEEEHIFSGVEKVIREAGPVINAP